MHRPFTARFPRRLLAWLLAVVVPVQALAAGMLAATGPLHTHVAASTRLVLDDLRRSPTTTAVRETHVFAAFGHFHAAAEPQRHHHAASDASAVVDPAASLASADASDAGAGPSLALFIGLVGSASTWCCGTASQAPATHAGWAPQTHEPALPERPPRRG